MKSQETAPGNHAQIGAIQMRTNNSIDNELMIQKPVALD